MGESGEQHDALHDSVVAIEHGIDDQLAEPSIVKICSVNTAPDRSAPKSSALKVTTGISALRSAWRRITQISGRPFAHAVRNKPLKQLGLL